MIDTFIRLQHRDGDDWHPMVETTDRNHSPVSGDPERSWLGRARIFRCERCATEISVDVPDEPARHPRG